MRHGPETAKLVDLMKISNKLHGYFGPKGIDIGFGGHSMAPIHDYIGYDKNHPEFLEDGKLPFADLTFDTVYSSHCLEHIVNYKMSIREWFRVLKTGGHMVLLLPHQYLYEKRAELPSKYNGDHKRFYTPASLMFEIEDSLMPNSYRLREMRDLDNGFDYLIPAEEHSIGNYSILCVIEKITPPEWIIK